MRFLACALLLVACTPTLSQPRGERHLAAMSEASRHYHHGRMSDAANAYGRAARTAERRVDRDEAEYRRARTLLRLERTAEAIAILDALAVRRPISRRTVRARFDAALLRIEQGETERAHASLLWIVRERPGDGQASRSLRILMEAREGQPLAERLAFLRGLYARVGRSDLGDDILNFEADLLAESGDRQGAMRVLSRLVREHPYPEGQRWDDALWQLADLAEEGRDYRRAIRYLQEMVQPQELTVTPGSQTLPLMPEAQLRIARIYRDRLRDRVHAAENFRLVPDRFPTSTVRDDALYELGVMWLEGGQREQGCSMLTRVVNEFEVGRARRLASERIREGCR